MNKILMDMNGIKNKFQNKNNKKNFNKIILNNHFACSFIQKSFNKASLTGLMLALPGFHDAGQTSPCSSVYWKA